MSVSSRMSERHGNAAGARLRARREGHEPQEETADSKEKEEPNSYAAPTLHLMETPLGETNEKADCLPAGSGS